MLVSRWAIIIHSVYCLFINWAIKGLKKIVWFEGNLSRFIVIIFHVHFSFEGVYRCNALYIGGGDFVDISVRNFREWLYDSTTI